MRAIDEVSGACMPVEQLPMLAEVRCVRGVEVVQENQRVWVSWPPDREEVLQRVLAVPGVRLFVKREAHWYELGRRLPARDVGFDGPCKPLFQALTPVASKMESPKSQSLDRVRLHLVPDDRTRQTTALRCSIDVLQRWIERTPCVQFERLKAVSADDEVLVVGDGLPMLPGNTRYWGERVLTPLGFRIEPELHLGVLQEVLGLSDRDFAIFCDSGVERFSRELFTDLSRGRVRLAAQRRR
jgi:hypothetical protein